MLLHLQKYRINRQLRQQSTGAMTMIELLVVITVIMILTAVMIPTIRYQNRNRALRVAERQLNAYIGSAQARAQQLGRPVGIWIERFRNEVLPSIAGANPGLDQNNVTANYAVTVYIAEVPLPYSGDVRDARVRLEQVQLTPTKRVWQLYFPATSVLRNPFNPLIRRGDHFQIQLDHRGHFFEAQRTSSPDQDGYVLTENPVGNGTRIPIAATTILPGPDGVWGRAAGNPAGFDGDDDGNGIIDDISEAGYPGSDDIRTGVPFQIHRRPTKAFVPPLNLPVGSVIDLSVSGTWTGGNEFWADNGNHPVIIMFQPSGGIKSVICNGNLKRPLGWVHLLVGRQNQVFPSAQFIQTDTEVGNIMDMNNRWVSIDHRTGSIVSENVASIARFIANSSDPDNLFVFDKIAAARQLVRSGSGSEGN
jgi:type II secretory pathway pseudopilin PulG